MITIQLIGVVVGLGAIHLTYLYYKRANFTKKEVLLWSTIWLTFIFVSIFPNSVRPVVGYLGLQRPMDLIMLIAFIVLFLLSFHNYAVTHRQERRLEEFVRKAALANFKKNQ
ncbi:hypothetical protein A3H10_03435 [Candidatus Uhrbacteria bacterium RIFCSPLOWO2_12_FULL_46_10]|uniref:DUF2304 domain-containing protein n=1 Tax=Candidatus Uhrbacteria bacterium RIFCSPLOWO2_01_FULL_47_25 TaxID=1802402 RepID=A0A1F7UPQ0_9BACT|nr:MAG: hypothetical protein UX68_C0020G0009 [Parcubacteria group bacterium GW2011_GWA2_46_9]OGL61005.1 MAG: hypothetical protein A2752_00735 [Candidatus Uhrbacteria bacterium RIFCSPHIGHO2_01_FULL_46_23]OGL69217.1 MAG: hypothetical protein A3D60_04940 [Candidatus Uhrbacteria bacterium RIFCSPHIGHO2_02_FULL_47_29]OGL80280.1 MAG: hypothetical protein A2936_02845 [Candidatus Uhrbacteria bacterium RIFCSPLOWO2_01_FULL_47_25]OGL85355.1 MAG: hypothetical protein A3I37_00750 [Candidatus Uhrbacteria bact